MRKLAALGLLALATLAAEAQETRYVTDILQLGLYSNREATGSPIRNLVSGTELTVLEQVPNYARVRTPDGEEGWVRSLYLIEEKPAQLRVAEVEARNAELEQAVETVIADRNAIAAEAELRVAEAEAELENAGLSRDRLAQLEAENIAYEQRMELYRGALPWPWVVGALVVIFAAGFFSGYWWLDAQIRRRHGGFRVY